MQHLDCSLYNILEIRTQPMKYHFKGDYRKCCYLEIRASIEVIEIPLWIHPSGLMKTRQIWFFSPFTLSHHSYLFHISWRTQFSSTGLVAMALLCVKLFLLFVLFACLQSMVESAMAIYQLHSSYCTQCHSCARCLYQLLPLPNACNSHTMQIGLLLFL